MACINGSLPSISSFIFVSDLPSYGLIGFISIGLILYCAYIITFARNHHTSSSSDVYTYFSQFSLFLLLLSPITFLFRPSASINIVCPTQTLSLQILPFCLLLGFNVHFAYEWLLKIIHPIRKSFLIAISSFLIFFLAILIQTAILLIWFYNNNNNNNDEQCPTECHRPLFLCSLIFNFFLLFLYSFQSSIRYHLNNKQNDFIHILTSLFALCITIIWICLYLFIPLRSSYTFYMNNNYILAYGTLFFAYAFIGPFLYEQLFYHKKIKTTTMTEREIKDKSNKINKMTFKYLSLTKEQQRAFMAAYIKRNLTASCENLTAKNISSSQQSNQTRHSTLSVDSLCPTLISTVSYESPPAILPMIINDTSSCGTLTSEYLLLPTLNDMKS
ncbi:unnamed protein product [Adineta steineri]|uniref:Uncharacterized protein n=1 Tax=Adineta steineri TaxID=433720 RepID=A0A814DMF2_9BILA|nr:unnamed protein product [Adineta steineri]